MSDAYARRDTDKESRLYAALYETLNDFIRSEPTGASNGVILAAMGECFAGTMAYFCATSLDTDIQAQERLAQWRNKPMAILHAQAWGTPNPLDDPDD